MLAGVVMTLVSGWGVIVGGVMTLVGWGLI